MDINAEHLKAIRSHYVDRRRAIAKQAVEFLNTKQPTGFNQETTKLFLIQSYIEQIDKIMADEKKGYTLDNL